jgi:hypothetical protein
MKKQRVRVKEFEADGYLQNTARLLQLVAICTLVGSGNMTREEVREMEKLSGKRGGSRKERG